MNRSTYEPGSGKPLRRLPRPRLHRWLSLVAGLAGAGLIATGLALFVAAPRVDPSPPEGYGAVPVSAPVPTSLPSHDSDGAGEGSVLDPPDAPAAVEGSSPTAPPVPVNSGRLEDVAGAPPPAPVRLRIEALGVDAPIQDVGVDGEEMEVPSSAGAAGWYRYGPVPGDSGSSVVAAHVSWGGRRGIFYDLRDLPMGAVIDVEFADGSVRRFRSVALASYQKEDLPVEQIFSRRGEPVLTLITCGGAFNPSLRSFEDNVVAYAVPVQEAFD